MHGILHCVEALTSTLQLGVQSRRQHHSAFPDSHSTSTLGSVRVLVLWRQM